MDWLDRLATTLGIDPLGPDASNDLLDAARDVAHRVERRITPLSTFLLGMRVEAMVAAGASRDAALADALADLRASLPPA